jgi:hypothetical protein
MKDPLTPMAIKMGFQLMSTQSKKGNAELFKWLFEMQVGKSKSNDKLEVTVTDVGNETFKAFIADKKE